MENSDQDTPKLLEFNPTSDTKTLDINSQEGIKFDTLGPMIINSGNFFFLLIPQKIKD